MPLRIGSFRPYLDYRARFDAAAEAGPVLWRAATLREVLSAAPLNERGALALSDPEAPDGFSFIDGLSITVLIVPGHSATRPHSHSWWHLFLVRSGRGAVRLEHGAIDDSSPTPIEAGDVLFVPAWREHSFRCSSTEDLSMLVFGNLPQQARLANKLERQSLESARSETLA